MDEEQIYGPYTLPEISVQASDQKETQNLLGLFQNLTNIAIAENAEKSLVGGDVISRPSIKVPSLQRYDNTCFQYGKNVCVESGYSNIPENVYDNRTFARNFEDYGFSEIAPAEMLPGDFIQYADNDKLSSEFPLGYPYHFGIVESDSTYTMSGGPSNVLGVKNPLSGDPVVSKNIYYNEDRTTKDPFRVYRLTNPQPARIAEKK